VSRGLIAALLTVWVWVVPGAVALAQAPTLHSVGESDSRVLDLAHPHFSQRIDEEHPAAFEFVRLIVAKVENPKRIGLIFEVAFIPDGGTRVPLGGFSLFPPDNPGSFIVSTRHLIHSPGSIEVSLHTATHVDPDTPLSIKMGTVTLAQGL
jgi:hypothetical protein